MRRATSGMTDFLEQVAAERRAYAAAARDRRSDEELLAGARANLAARAGSHVSEGDAFSRALAARRNEGRLAVIAEVKRVSPALGPLATDLDPAAQAERYVALGDDGAAAISVLTEPLHWGGSLDDLARVRAAVGVPVLCKDVVVSDYQIVEARAAGADAVLLIAEALDDRELRRFIDRARGLDMGVLVEAHEAAAFERAVRTGAPVVGVNARDLRRPATLDRARIQALHDLARDGQLLVAESGVSSVEDAQRLPARVDAVLVGTALMRADDPAPLIRALASVRRTGERTRTTRLAAR